MFLESSCSLLFFAKQFATLITWVGCPAQGTVADFRTFYKNSTIDTLVSNTLEQFYIRLLLNLQKIFPAYGESFIQGVIFCALSFLKTLGSVHPHVAPSWRRSSSAALHLAMGKAGQFMQPVEIALAKRHT